MTFQTNGLERITAYRIKVRPHEGKHAVFVDGVPIKTGLTKPKASVIRRIKLADLIRKTNTEMDKLASAASRDA